MPGIPVSLQIQYTLCKGTRTGDMIGLLELPSETELKKAAQNLEAEHQLSAEAEMYLCDSVS